jgi:geranyl-CoA carboxylase alpha subunit
VQRRNQKVVEEAPSPAVDDALRLKMGAAAVAAAKAVDYVGAGTVEFMLAKDGAFYFLEMNTRLQVEHPVTELVYGCDLVEWQLRVAQGEKLPLTQEEILDNRYGHAIEVRLCAEDPQENYLPQTGPVLRWAAPTGEGVRVDTYLESGCAVSPFYDSMQAKIIAFGDDRETARQRLLKALADTRFLGLVNNKDYLSAILGHEAFAGGDFSTGFIGQYFPQEAINAAKPSAKQLVLAAVALYLDDARRLQAEHGIEGEMIGWHSSHETGVDFKLKCRGVETELELLAHDGHLFTGKLGGDAPPVVIDVTRHDAQGFAYVADGVQGKAFIARQGDTLWLEAEGRSWPFVDRTLAPVEGPAAGSDGRLLAHSDGKVVAVHVKPGDVIEKGQTLAVLEAMKMEFQLSLPVGGVVEAVAVVAGTQVRNKTLLVQVKPAG